MIYLGLGSNLSSSLGNRFENINLSINLLKGYGIQTTKKSSYYETPSYPDKNNPKFINIVAEVSTNLFPVDLMSVLIFIEEKLGRKRNKKNDPRTSDIDIIDYKGKVLNFNYKSLNLSIPHEKLSKRNFVLLPLQEICPHWRHPKTKESIAKLIKKLSDEDKKSILKIEKN